MLYGLTLTGKGTAITLIPYRRIRVNKSLKIRTRAPKIAESRNLGHRMAYIKAPTLKRKQKKVYNARELRTSLGGQTLGDNLKPRGQ